MYFFADFIFSYTISLLKKVQIVLNDIDENYGKLMSMHWKKQQTDPLQLQLILGRQILQ